MEILNKYKDEIELFYNLSDLVGFNAKKINELTQKKLDWGFILGNLSYNRMAGIAYHILQKSNLDEQFLNREFRFNLFMIHEFQKVRTKSNRKYIKELSESLIANNISHVFLKGSVLSNTLYPLGCRVSNDVDILINNGDIGNVLKILKELNYVQGDYNVARNEVIPAKRSEIINSRINYGEIVSHIKVVNESGLDFVLIDVNFSLDGMPTGTEDKVERFLESRVKYRCEDDLEIFSLSKEIMMLYLCVHLYKEATSLYWIEKQRDLGFYKFHDIYFLLNTEFDDSELDKFIKITQDYGLITEVKYSFLMIEKYFNRTEKNNKITYILQALTSDNDPTMYAYDLSNASVKFKWKNDLESRLFNFSRFSDLELMN